MQIRLEISWQWPLQNSALSSDLGFPLELITSSCLLVGAVGVIDERVGLGVNGSGFKSIYQHCEPANCIGMLNSVRSVIVLPQSCLQALLLG